MALNEKLGEISVTYEALAEILKRLHIVPDDSEIVSIAQDEVSRRSLITITTETLAPCPRGEGQPVMRWAKITSDQIKEIA